MTAPNETLRIRVKLSTKPKLPVQCRIIGSLDSFCLSTMSQDLSRLTARTKRRKTRMLSFASLLLLNSLGSDTVHVHDSLLGESLSHGDGGSFLRVEPCSSDKTCFFKLHQAEADVLSCSFAAMFWLSSIATLGAVVLAKTIDSNLLASVELVCDRGCTSVKPVLVIWAQFFLATSLNVGGPLLNIIKISTGID